MLRPTLGTLQPLFASCALALCALALAGCPTRVPYDVAYSDAAWDLSIDPRVPSVGAGRGAPSCAPEEVIDINALGFRQDRQLRLRVDTRNRRNELHPGCVDRDSTEAVIRYTAPAATQQQTVQAIRVSTVADATEFDTVLAVRNDCGPEYRDYSCNNDGFLDDGRETRRSTVYYTELEPEQFVYILVDGFDGSQGQAEVVIDEITDLGTAFNPCLPVPPAMSTDPRAPTAGFRCPVDGVRCRPGAAADGTDLCLPLLPIGAPCDPEERRNVCEDVLIEGVLCAQNPRSRTEAVCALPGTAAGAICRHDEPRCDGRLACSPGSGFGNRDICVPLRGMGASCDPAMVGYVDRCESGLTCCGDSADAGANFTCRPPGETCFPPAPAP